MNETPGVTPEMVPQPHGGALKVGNPGNRGGPGRPPSALRDRLRDAYDQRIPVLEQVADGEALVRARVPLASVLEHAACPKCGDKLKAKDAATLMLVEINGMVSAGVGDRLKALDQMAKYGLGKQVDADDVRGRLRTTLDLLERELPSDVFQRVYPLLKEVWK